MTLPAYFLDTNILVAAFLIEKSDARRLLELGRARKVRLLTSEYVLRELRFTLPKKIRVPTDIVDSFVLDVISLRVLILKKPSRQEVRAFTWRAKDRSDIPIILPCVKHRLTLVTMDRRLAKSARERIEVRSPRQAVREISGSG